MFATMVGQRQKIKKTNWQKQSPKKQNLDKNINDSKSHVWNSFLENIHSDIQLFYIRSNVPVEIIRVFLISDLLAESLKAKKDHSVYNTVLLRKPHSFYESRLTWYWG